MKSRSRKRNLSLIPHPSSFPSGLYWMTHLDGIEFGINAQDIAKFDAAAGEAGGSYIYPSPYDPGRYFHVKESIQDLFSRPVLTNGQRKR